MHLTQRSAVWTTRGDTTLRTMVGWNIEIMFMFTLLGIIFYHTLTGKNTKILVISEKWFWAVVYSAFCVFVECLGNIDGHLVWEYEFWNLSCKGVWLIFLFGYFHFFFFANIVTGLSSIKKKIVAVSIIYGVPLAMNIGALGILG
ncbi:MAG: hypothetical protein ACUVRK_04765 [Spirochaetota bacterium]